MISAITASPLLVRVVPFAGFLLLTFLQGRFGEASRYWVYVLKTVAGAGMVLAVRPWIEEMRWKLSAAAVITGLAVFALWIGLDAYYPKLNDLLGRKAAPVAPWNPFLQFGPALAWFFVLVRIVGSSLVVPPLEEVFFRSFLYRYIARLDFLSVPLKTFLPLPFFVVALAFGLEHREWLAGILCGLAYQGLVCAKGRLDDAIAAHAITNFLLGVWVVARGAWNFW